MSGKQEKKLRQLVRRKQTKLCEQSWDVFFDTMSKLKLRYRIKMAWKVLIGKPLKKDR